MDLDFSSIRRVHMIGIGGISMSGLAEALIAGGITVTGSDRGENDQTAALRQAGCAITLGHTAVREAAAADLVVYTAAIPVDNPEYTAALESGVPVIARAQLLGYMMAQRPVGIGIAGTHGKTTTTALAAALFLACGADPSVHCGGVIPLMGSTTRQGQGPHYISEVDEYSRSFLHMAPRMAIITNLEHDHPDIFPTLEDMLETFRQFAERLPADGALLIADEDRCRAVAAHAACRVATYGLHAGCDFWADDIAPAPSGMTFTFHAGPNNWPVALGLPGLYNVQNATAALGLACLCGLDLAKGIPAWAGFGGARRRFELFGHTPNGCRVISDYAHHPTAVSAVLSAGRAACGGRIFLVFQPHTYSRTAIFCQEYRAALAEADQTYLLDIWAARDFDRGAVSACDLIDPAAADHVFYAPDRAALAADLRRRATEQDIILCAGAGDIEAFCRLLAEKG